MVINQAGNKSFMSYISISMTTIYMAKFIVFKFIMATSNILIFHPPP